MLIKFSGPASRLARTIITVRVAEPRVNFRCKQLSWISLVAPTCSPDANPTERSCFLTRNGGAEIDKLTSYGGNRKVERFFLKRGKSIYLTRETMLLRLCDGMILPQRAALLRETRS